MSAQGKTFANRREAGRELAQALLDREIKNPIVLALPRGGVPVGFEVAKSLGAPLDILLVRKIGAPGHEEYGIGALVDGASPQIVIDEAAARMVGATPDYILAETQKQLAELERRRTAYSRRPPLPLKGETVIVVDDGVATGGTVKAALLALRKSGAGKTILAVPVGPADALETLRPLCDEIICLTMPSSFYAVGAHYGNFDQTSDAEVVSLLDQAAGLGH